MKVLVSNKFQRPVYGKKAIKKGIMFKPKIPNLPTGVTVTVDSSTQNTITWEAYNG